MDVDIEKWDSIIAGLQGKQRLRVWSVIITVFGDAIVPRGGSIPLKSLQEILGRLGIEAGAVRTALSRLASEGWVIRERRGRLSHYSLDKRGRSAFDEATQLIYAPGPPEWDGRWSVAVPTAGNGDAGAELEAIGFVSRGGTWIRPEVKGAKPLPERLEHYLVIHDQPGIAPVDAHSFWSLDAVRAAIESFRRSLEPLAAALDGDCEPAPLDAIALRTLLIHEWRRIILRSPALPAELLPSSWPCGDARATLKAIYGKLIGPSEAWLTEQGLPPLDDPDAFAARFGGNQSSR
ncbi:PaaX family transcriptional regulator [Oricola thermophila]|uniref:GntR family transcriptional regulator n=1 Tax=Oricola thermophila TaxID=2742145 RepID=A0A6N1V935_9HYPH|nr:PaaX family transcriptional regulator C-terminal domain-containing protein [Oricola thermophila]QKV17466.1 GntR family transcriptional regulator [Oricola thermophila]